MRLVDQNGFVRYGSQVSQLSPCWTAEDVCVVVLDSSSSFFCLEKPIVRWEERLYRRINTQALPFSTFP